MLAAIPFPNIDPAIFTIPAFSLFGIDIGPLALRWYALAYIAGLVLGWRYIVRLLAAKRLWPSDRRPMAPERAEDLLIWTTIGVVIGGRLGYILFYDFGSFLESPLEAFRVWNGGMSFHGGMLGVIVAVMLFARSSRVPLFQLGDAVACAAPIGLFFGRVANFINGELWGRVTEQSWGVVFPQVEAAAKFYPWLLTDGVNLPRHPSQLYEAGLEGLVLFMVLAWFVWRAGALKHPGLATGVFLIGYGLARGFVEFFRQPDAHIGFDIEALGLELSRGQLLSIPMILLGVAFILMARTGRRDRGARAAK